MAVLEVPAVALGSAITRLACALWLGEPFEAAVALPDLLKDHVRNRIEQRRAERFFEDCGDVVAARLLELLQARRFRRVPSNEREAAACAVSDLLTRTGLSDRTLLARDLDPVLIERHLDAYVPEILERAALSDPARTVFGFLLKEACAYLVQIVTVLPSFAALGLQETLRRQTTILERLQSVLDRLPQRRRVEDFQVDYLRLVSRLLDRMEIFGARLRGPAHAYPLSIAFLTLTAMEFGNDSFGRAPKRVDAVLAVRRNVLIAGEAGSGKTTLLRWLAVKAATDDLPSSMAAWNGMVPVFLSLRRYVGRPLPTPDEFVAAVAPAIAGEAPPGWIHAILRRGRALVLVDGVDELPEGERAGVKRWLRELLTAFPRSSYVVSSRPEALDDDWAEFSRSVSTPDARKNTAFTWVRLQPMSMGDVREFVQLWHTAVREEVRPSDDRDELAESEQAVMAALEEDRHLRRLAVNPLLCALLCALNQELRMRLPRSRMEIYEAALTMLLDQRDRERGVVDGRPVLTKTEKVMLLQGFALWLVRNGRSDAATDEAADCLARVLLTLRREGEAPASEVVLRHLLERSGLVREPATGRVDFIHRTFQEYLAAKAAIEADGVGELIRNAGDDQWREVVILAAGHAQPRQCAELMTGLLARTETAKDPSARLMPVACLQSVRSLDPELRHRVERSVTDLMPPQSLAVAEILASAGDFVLDLLPLPTTANEAIAIITTAKLIGGDDALGAIARLVAQRQVPAKGLEQFFLDAWSSFDADEYATRVLSHLDLSDSTYEFADVHALPALRRLSDLKSITLRLVAPAQFPPGFVAESVVSLSLQVSRLHQSLMESPIAVSDHSSRVRNAVHPDESLFSRACKDMAADIATSFPNLWLLSIVRLPFDDLRQFPVSTTARTILISRWRDIRSLEGWGDCPNLETLTFAACNLGGVDLSPLTCLPKLTTVNFHSMTSDGTTVPFGALLGHPALTTIAWPSFVPLDLGGGTRPSHLPVLTIKVASDRSIRRAEAAGDRVVIQVDDVTIKPD